MTITIKRAYALCKKMTLAFLCRTKNHPVHMIYNMEPVKSILIVNHNIDEANGIRDKACFVNQIDEALDAFEKNEFLYGCS